MSRAHRNLQQHKCPLLYLPRDGDGLLDRRWMSARREEKGIRSLDSQFYHHQDRVELLI